MKAKHPYGIAPFKSPDSWAKKSKVSHLTVGEGDEKRVVGIKVSNDKEKFIIPVVDARFNLERVESMEKAANTGSKFFRPSFSLLGYSYNVSRKDDLRF